MLWAHFIPLTFLGVLIIVKGFSYIRDTVLLLCYISDFKFIRYYACLFSIILTLCYTFQAAISP